MNFSSASSFSSVDFSASLFAYSQERVYARKLTPETDFLNTPLTNFFEPLCGTDFLPHGSNLLPRGNNPLPDGSNLLPGGSNFLPHGNNPLPHGSDFLPRASNHLPDGRKFLPSGKTPQTGHFNAKTSILSPIN